MIDYNTVKADQDLHQILHLQARNLPQNITDEEARTQGFVTVHHDFDLLKRMNEPYPHVVAWDEGQVIGYALVMLRSFQNDIPVLVSMFQKIDDTFYKGEKLGEAKYFVMGQVCIDKNYRGQGVFAGLYREMQRQMRPYFDYIITEVDKRNTRSLRAHEKVGFEKVQEYRSGVDWVILLLPTKI
ncbi:MAG: GNAT family N-acetyltransferase [Saprospiraceae bacterium]